MRAIPAILLSSLVFQTATATKVLSESRPQGSSIRRASVQATPLIEITNGLVSAKLEDAPLAKVLELIAQKTGARIVLHGPADEKVTVEFENQLFEEGLRRIFQGRNAAYFYGLKSVGMGNAAAVMPSEIRVFGLEVDPSDQTTVFVSPEPGTGNQDAQAQAVAEVRSPALLDLVKRQVEADDSEASREAAQARGDSFDPAPFSALVDTLLVDADASVRAAAADALGRTWDDRAVEPLAQSVLEDSSAAVREAAARALGLTWSEDAVDSLMMALTSDPAATVREQAAWALGQTAGEEALPALIQALTQDPRWFVREAAASAVGAIGGLEAIGALAWSASADGDESVREAAADALLSCFM